MELKLIFKKRIYKIWKCRNCGFGRLEPMPKLSDLNRLYQAGYHQLISEVDYRADAQKKFSCAKQYLTPDTVLLDYGCGEGYFLSLVNKAGGKAWGYDISRAAVKTAKDRFGLRIKTGKLKSDLFDKNQFEVITAFDVIEHIPDFKPVIKLWFDWLKPGGTLVITTPNLESWDAKLLKSRWYGFTKIDQGEHVNYFTPDSVRLVLAKTGFRVDRVKLWGFVRSFNYLASQILKKEINIFPGQLYLPITDMIILARKAFGQLK